jgi:ABC-type nitrate/sulfonate/bicarbonate transport system permease component
VGAEGTAMTVAADALPVLDPSRLESVPTLVTEHRARAITLMVLGRLGSALLSIVIVLVAWQVFLWVLDVNSFIGRGPVDVWNFLTSGPDAAAARATLWDASVVTLTDAGIGLLAGAVCGICVAVAFNLVPPAEHTFMPMAVVLRSVPLVAMTPLIALIFGRGLLAVTVISGIVTFFPVLVSVSLALRTTPRASLDLCQAYGAGSFATLRKVQFPTALPALFGSLRVAAPLALVGALLAEWLATGDGLGYLMLQSMTLSNYNMLWAATALVTAYSVLAYSIISAIERLVLARFAGT